MNVVILGCGRVGAFLAGLLDADGHAVTIIDIDRGSFAHLPAGFKGTTILGDGVDLDVMRQAGIDKAEAYLSLTDGDNRNLMAAQIAKKIFGVPRVTAKVNDPIRARIYREQGIETFSRTTILGTLLHATLTGNKEIGPRLLALAEKHEEDMAGVAERRS